MKIQNRIDNETGESLQNEFVVVDDIGDERGSCKISENYLDLLIPERPHQIHITMDGGSKSVSLMIGAAIMRALTIAKEGDCPARIYMACAPEETELMDQMEMLGFHRDDALVRMGMDLYREDWLRAPEMPRGVIEVKDDLQDATEAKYFLMRFNKLMSEDRDIEFVERLAAMPGFRRYLLINSEGLVAETIIVLGRREATVLFLQVNERYRRNGMGTLLMQYAFHCLVREGITGIHMDVRAGYPGNVEFFEQLGFGMEKVIAYYPCIDWEPEQDAYGDSREMPHYAQVRRAERDESLAASYADEPDDYAEEYDAEYKEAYEDDSYDEEPEPQEPAYRRYPEPEMEEPPMRNMPEPDDWDDLPEEPVRQKKRIAQDPNDWN